MGFTDPSVNFPKGATFPIDITFDGQAQFNLVAVASSPVVAAAVLPDPAVSQFRKSHLMVLQGKTHTLQFPLSSTDNLAMVIENCVIRMNDGGLSGAGDFSIGCEKIHLFDRTGGSVQTSESRGGDGECTRRIAKTYQCQRHRFCDQHGRAHRHQ